MSVTTTSNRISYDGDAVSTVFSFPYKFLATSDLKVYVDDVLQVITTDYTVGTPGDSGANVTFLSAPPAGDNNIVILRDVDLLQSTDLPSNGPFPSVSVETMVDKVTLQVQRLRELVSRAFTLSDSDTSGASTVLPTPTASNVIGWNETASALRNFTPETFASLVAYGTANADIFSGDGTTTQFTLTEDPVALNNMDVSVSGVTQTPGIDYTWVSGTTLTFTSAPPVGTDNILVRYMEALPQGQGDAAATSYLPDGTGATTTTVQDKLREIISVKDFGAVGDGVTDDSAAINAAFEHVRNLIDNTTVVNGTAIKIVFPPGQYSVESTINATSLRALHVTIECWGATIIGRCTGKPVIDALNSRYWTFRDIALWGDEDNMPTIGIQVGRTELVASSAGDGNMENVAINGYFSFCGFYNFTSETCRYEHLRISNRNPLNTAYCLVMDGTNHFDIQSDFVTQQNPPDTAVSFNENTFYSCDFRKDTSGHPILLVGQISRHQFIGSYAVSFDTAAVYVLKPVEISHLHLDLHCEVDDDGGGTELQNILLVDNTSGAGNIPFFGLRIKDHNPQCDGALIEFTGTTYSVRFDGCEIECGNPKNTVPVFGATAGASKVFFSGDLKWQSTKNLDISGAYFTGAIYTIDTTSITHTLGSYEVIRRPSATAARIHEHKGYIRVSGTSEGVDASNYLEVRGAGAGGNPRLVVGGTDADIGLSVAAKGAGVVTLEATSSIAFEAQGVASGVNYIRSQAAAAGGRPILSAQGSDTNIDLSLAPKGTGNVRFGTHTANADAPITGYITIKDASGNARKLAVIT
jgi:hypothetical protein